MKYVWFVGKRCSPLRRDFTASRTRREAGGKYTVASSNPEYQETSSRIEPSKDIFPTVGGPAFCLSAKTRRLSDTVPQLWFGHIAAGSLYAAPANIAYISNINGISFG